MKSTKTRMLVEGGIMIALAQILSYVKFFEAPYGGSVTAGSMVPILIFAIRWGAKDGLFVGFIYGILQLILEPKITPHIFSIIFDYPVAFMFLGLAGLFNANYKGIFAGMFLGIFGRFICHVMSGVIVFASYAPEGQHPLIYSVLYNGSYLAIELIISFLVGWMLLKFAPNIIERQTI